ncbi:MAG: CinA family nicotinamide mononucleotide deamidase-related protein [Myxococcaceae bacterium]
MRIEAVCTGDELLTGLTTDTNSTYFSEQLIRHGAALAAIQVVRDVREEIVEALRVASARADLVLVSGGLGPTTDDITAECAARAAGVSLEEDERVVANLRERFARRGLRLSENNMRQAKVPHGARVYVGDIGSAPSFSLRIGRAQCFFVAGVPREYRHWVNAEVLPAVDALRAQSGAQSFSALRLLRTMGIAESHLDERIRPLVGQHPSVTFGFRTQAPENHLKLFATGPTQTHANDALAAAEVDARALLADFVFGADDERLETVVGGALRERGATVAVAESCTGGAISELLSGPAGASAWFLGGAVTYANDMKQRWADVPEVLLRAHGAVSSEVALAMAKGVRHSAHSTYGLSVTGISGPSGATPEKPVGLVFLGLDGPEGSVVEHHVYPGDRALIRRFATYGALNVLRRVLSP